MRRCLTVSAAALLSALLMSPAAKAQGEVERFQRTLERIERQTRVEPLQNVPLDQRMFFDAGGLIALTIVNLDGPDDNNHTLRQYDLIGWAQLNIDGVHDFFLRGRSTYRDWGNSSDALDPAGDDWEEARLDRAVYRFDLGRAVAISEGQQPETGLVFQGGRQLVHWANGLIMSMPLDAVLLTVTHGDLSITGLAGFTVRGTFDIDPGRPGYDGDTKRGFFGGIASYQINPRHRIFVEGLVQKDYNDDDVRTDDIGIIGDPSDDLTTRFHYDSFYVGGGLAGNLSDNLLYGIEAVFQGGETFSDSLADDDTTPITQTRDDIKAWALDAQLNYLFADEHDTRATLELIVASGDDDRDLSNSSFGGNSPNSDDNGFLAFGLLNTGLALSPEVSNIIVVRGGASTFPLPGSTTFKKLLVGADLFLFNKYDKDAPINEETHDSGFLGFEGDIYAHWQATSDVALAVRYGAFIPSGAFADESVRHFLFTTISFGF